METNLNQYITIAPDAKEKMNARSGLFLGKFHPITNFLDVSPSDVINESSNELGIYIASHNKTEFDKSWKRHFFKIFNEAKGSIPSELKEYLDKSTSNGYQLGLQAMLLAPGKYFKIHAHPNIEFGYTILGTLREFRWFFHQPHDEISATAVSKDLIKGPTIPSLSPFEEHFVSQGHCMLNETGSVHQSFTAPEEGCILLVLWSGVHANTHPGCCFQEDERLRPAAGW